MRYLGEQSYGEAKQGTGSNPRAIEKRWLRPGSRESGGRDGRMLPRLGMQAKLRACLRTTNIMERLNTNAKERALSEDPPVEPF